MTTSEQRLRMAKAIVDFEARRDKSGHLQVYHLPANDGGGSYEVAGINDRYNKAIVERLVTLINAGKYSEAEDYACRYIEQNTNPVLGWHDDAGVEFYLRDTCFNRGAKGAARILQRAVHVADDGEVGPNTRAGIARYAAPELLAQLRWAREDYEQNVVGYRANFWHGLVNRWDKALATAQGFSAEHAIEAPKPTPAAPDDTPWYIKLLQLLLALCFFKRAPAPAPTPTPAPVFGEPRWFTLAKGDIGFHEVGNNRGLDKFLALAKCGNNGDPWCAIFVNAKLEQAGVPGTRSAMARSFEKHPEFVKLAGPALGAIATFWRGSPTSGSGHTNFYAGTDSQGRHIGLGGNQSDGVRAAYMDMKRHTGWWWPKSVPLPHGGAVRVDGLKAVSAARED